MICYDILTAALRLLGEPGDADDNHDYAERAIYIIASFIGEAREVDAKYRLAHGLDKAEISEYVFVSLDDEFPLSERLAYPASFYLASLLIADESPELSESYYERYCDSISAICASLPSHNESITDVYYK